MNVFDRFSRLQEQVDQIRERSTHDEIEILVYCTGPEDHPRISGVDRWVQARNPVFNPHHSGPWESLQKTCELARAEHRLVVSSHADLKFSDVSLLDEILEEMGERECAFLDCGPTGVMKSEKHFGYAGDLMLFRREAFLRALGGKPLVSPSDKTIDWYETAIARCVRESFREDQICMIPCRVGSGDHDECHTWREVCGFSGSWISSGVKLP